jgi:hypothetical protein
MAAITANVESQTETKRAIDKSMIFIFVANIHFFFRLRHYCELFFVAKAFFVCFAGFLVFCGGGYRKEIKVPEMVVSGSGMRAPVHLTKVSEMSIVKASAAGVRLCEPGRGLPDNTLCRSGGVSRRTAMGIGWRHTCGRLCGYFT